jgi:hypothetical protein
MNYSPGGQKPSRPGRALARDSGPGHFFPPELGNFLKQYSLAYCLFFLAGTMTATVAAMISLTEVQEF